MRRLRNREELTGAVEIEHTGDVSFRVRGRKVRDAGMGVAELSSIDKKK